MYLDEKLLQTLAVLSAILKVLRPLFSSLLKIQVYPNIDFMVSDFFFITHLCTNSCVLYVKINFLHLHDIKKRKK